MAGSTELRGQGFVAVKNELVERTWGQVLYISRASNPTWMRTHCGTDLSTFLTVLLFDKWRASYTVQQT